MLIETQLEIMATSILKCGTLHCKSLDAFNTTFDGEIDYPDSFNIRDYASDLMFFQQAKASGVESATLTKEIDKEIARAIVDNDEKLSQIFEEIDTKPEVGSFTQDEPQQEDQEVEEESI